MSQPAKQLRSFPPGIGVGHHRGHVITAYSSGTAVLGVENCSKSGVAIAELVKDPCEAGKVPGTEGTDVLRVMILWQKSSIRKAQRPLRRPDRGAEQDAICPGQPPKKRDGPRTVWAGRQ